MTIQTYIHQRGDDKVTISNSEMRRLVDLLGGADPVAPLTGPAKVYADALLDAEIIYRAARVPAFLTAAALTRIARDAGVESSPLVLERNGVQRTVPASDVGRTTDENGNPILRILV
ncbi:MAG TPA: hypothetical protein VLA56_03965 [Pseudomonadales bacterium]|nr:hypothetical protein [Pseudomonadales bacterium]